MCKFLDFWDFGFWRFLEFGDWGFWIWIFAKFWILRKIRRLCTPTRVGGFCISWTQIGSSRFPILWCCWFPTVLSVSCEEWKENALVITPEVLQKYAKPIKQAKLEEFRSFLDFTAMKFRGR